VESSRSFECLSEYARHDADRTTDERILVPTGREPCRNLPVKGRVMLISRGPHGRASNRRVRPGRAPVRGHIAPEGAG